MCHYCRRPSACQDANQNVRVQHNGESSYTHGPMLVCERHEHMFQGCTHADESPADRRRDECGVERNCCQNVPSFMHMIILLPNLLLASGTRMGNRIGSRIGNRLGRPAVARPVGQETVFLL